MTNQLGIGIFRIAPADALGKQNLGCNTASARVRTGRQYIYVVRSIVSHARFRTRRDAISLPMTTSFTPNHEGHPKSTTGHVRRVHADVM